MKCNCWIFSIAFFLPAEEETAGRGGVPRKIIDSHTGGPHEVGEDDGRFQFNQDQIVVAFWWFDHAGDSPFLFPWRVRTQSHWTEPSHPMCLPLTTMQIIVLKNPIQCPIIHILSLIDVHISAILTETYSYLQKKHRINKITEFMHN